MNCCAVCCHKQFGPGGCQVPVVKESGNAKCGQTDSLDIIDKVVEEFENKMKQLDAVATGDSVSGLQAKLHLQEELIRNLTVQNEMLVMVVKKLEAEATKRASKPEEKFVKTAEIGIEKYSDEDAIYDKRMQELEQELEKALQESENERRKRNQEISNLKETIVELEKALQNAQIQGENAQSALQENIQLVDELYNRDLLETHKCDVLRMKLQTFSKQIELMRDQILDLEVENFAYIQDVEILENRLSKYQGIFRNHKECTELRTELAKLRSENERQSNLNIAFTEKIVSMGSELEAAYTGTASCDVLKKTISVLHQSNEELQKEIKKIKHELIQETRLNEIDGERVEELTHSLNQKVDELVQSEEKCTCTKKQLDAALNEISQLQNEASMLMNSTACYEQQSVLSEERTIYCQNEIENCNKNLHCLNEKLIIMKDILRQKDEQYSELETYYYVQTNALECSKKIYEEGKAHYKSDIADLKQTIKELNDKLMNAEHNYHALHEDYKKSQVLIVDASHRESKMQQDCVRCSKELSQRVQALEAEEVHAREYARQVESQNGVLRNDLLASQRQKELLKSQLTRLKSAATAQVNGAQEEINNLKNELNKIIQQHSKTKSENDSLRLEISHIQAYEQQNRTTGEQLDQCLHELHNVQVEKQRVEAANQKMLKEFNSLREAYKNMDRDHQRLSQSVISVEQDLAVTKNSRDELCLESRNVINNVQSWLWYQILINEQLKIKLRDNYVLINKLESELSYLDSENNCCCTLRQRGGTSRSTSFPLSQRTQKLNINIDVHETSTPCSTVTNSTNDWFTYTDSDDESIQELDLSHICIRKVESITQQLQKSNDYWVSQMVDNDYMVTRDQ